MSGVLAGIVLVTGICFVYILYGGLSVAADAKPPVVERTLAQYLLNHAIDGAMPAVPGVYIRASDAVLTNGADLYGANCAVCHGNGVTSGKTFVKGFYIKAPQFMKHGVDDDPIGTTYWKIDHGIRFTAMPAFNTVLTVDQMWAISAFLKRSPGALPTAAKAIWRRRLASS